LPSPGAPQVSDWSVCIYTLGRFSLLKDGVCLRFEHKAQKRPIELLQTLIALGGRQVHQIQLEDALWSNASGRSAHQSFNMALHRLRHLIGHESLRLEEGKLTLDPLLCWVDVWAFERRIHNIEALRQQAATLPAEIYLLIKGAIDLLQGQFLCHEIEQPWMLPLREKLRHRVQRLFTDLGRCLGREGRCEEAISLYHRALEIDPLAEEFYRHLMICYAALDRHPESLAAYHYCCKALYHQLNAPPSPLTEALLQAIQQQDRNFINPYCTACRTAK
jgi:DNA-binding SARP family transcriptional activator